jgi:phosphatidylcholine synthase
MWPAALVHLFTATGAICGLLATLAVLKGAWEEVFWWLGLALVIDGIDGTFARLAKVDRRLPRFSGDRLDLVVDYVTYVFVPTLALLEAGYLPGYVGLVLGGMILLSSLYHFSDTESKADDYSFVGFPAIWNIVAFYVFALALPAWAAAALVIVCVGLTFIPLKWAHPLRTAAWRPLTVAACALWVGGAVSVLVAGFPARAWEQSALLLPGAYAIALTLLGGRVQGADTR